MSDQKAISIERLKSLVELTARINEKYTDPNAMLVSILEAVMALVQCESSSILLVNNEDSSLRFMVALGPKGAAAENIKVSKNSIAGWVVENNQSVIINDVPNDKRLII